MIDTCRPIASAAREITAHHRVVRMGDDVREQIAIAFGGLFLGEILDDAYPFAQPPAFIEHRGGSTRERSVDAVGAA